MEYSQEVLRQLKNADIRAEIDDRNEKIGKKIRDTELLKVPYMFVIGEKEVAENKVSLRKQGKGDAGAVQVSAVINDLIKEIKERQ